MKAVLVHGTGEVPSCWNAVVAALGGDWSCSALKRPEDLDRARVPERFVLVGHSYGGWEALRYAARRRSRVERLVIIEPPAFAVLQGWDDATLDAVMAVATPPISVRMMIDFWHGEGTWESLPDMRQLMLLAEEPRARRQVARASKLPAPLEALAALDVPTLVIAGTETNPAAIRVCERIAELLPQARLELLEGAGHASQRTHPQRISELIVSG
jgi:pimeloyl-ACP methyl ester carboxylesterase